MPYQKNISQSKKAKATIFAIAKYGNVCWYCKMPFIQEIHGLQRTIDHFNCNEEDQRLENLCLCHMDCQQEKKTNTDWQILAQEQLKKNTDDPDFLKIAGDRGGVSAEEKTANTDELTDGEVNRIINKTTITYLNEHLKQEKPDDSIKQSDAANSITFLVQKETGGRGSTTAVMRALEVQCCSISEFVIDKTKRPFMIRRRNN